ncbi:SHOCT domain-containing protein [Amycolatopsis taiwanensis]|uniref:SHOCT domain-containing protein n=1 Tax=Amycolatopsis taiwanensis TaxID=342230 RepID=A0A9W6VC16_9PSEU|nr:hypothetical protein [Amycolatopsis taiwanensis]GLY65618.1 hypothetical protein Atai01_22370 [Amycolatopsis taiwanensis]
MGVVSLLTAADYPAVSPANPRFEPATATGAEVAHDLLANRQHNLAGTLGLTRGAVGPSTRRGRAGTLEAGVADRRHGDAVMMYWYGNGMGGWGYVLWTVSTIAFWVVVIAGLVALVRYFSRRPMSHAMGPRGSQPPRPSPEQLLAERFARGEIDENEFHRAMDTLRQHHSSTPAD